MGDRLSSNRRNLKSPPESQSYPPESQSQSPSSKKIKACLMAPSFSPNRSTTSNNNNIGNNCNKSTFSSSTNMNTRPSASSASASASLMARRISDSNNSNDNNDKIIHPINNAITRAYTRIQQQRATKRQQLVKKTLRENDRAIRIMLESNSNINNNNNNLKQQQQAPPSSPPLSPSISCFFASPSNSSSPPSSPTITIKNGIKNGIKKRARQHVATDIESSPLRLKKKHRTTKKSTATNVNNQTVTMDINVNGEEEEKKNDSDVDHVDHTFGMMLEGGMNHTTNNMIDENVNDVIDENVNDEQQMKIQVNQKMRGATSTCTAKSIQAEGERSGSGSGSGSTGNDKPSSSSSSLLYTMESKQSSSSSSLQSTSASTSTSTLIFPRLPSNECDGEVHPYLQQFCQPCDEKQQDYGDHDEYNIMLSTSAVAASTSASTAANINASSNNQAQAKPPPASLSNTNNNKSTSTNNNHSNHYSKQQNPQNPQQQQYYTLAIKTSCHSQHTTLHTPHPITGTHMPPLPKSSSLIFLKTNLAIPDEPSLSHVPYFGDGDNEDIYSDLFDTEERERLYEFGTGYMEIETLGCVDEVLRELVVVRNTSGGGGGGGGGGKKEWRRVLEDEDVYKEAIRNSNNDSTTATTTDDEPRKIMMSKSKQADVQKLERIHIVLAELAGVDLIRVQERHKHCFFSTTSDGGVGKGGCCGGNNDDSKAAAALSSSPSSSSNNKNLAAAASKASSPPTTLHKKNSDTFIPVPYESIMDSYRDLLCRRCFTYDCNLHGNLPKADLNLLGELAVQKKLDGHWKELDQDITATNECYFVNNNGKRKAVAASNDINDSELTPAQESICKRAYLMFQGDIEKIAKAIGAQPATVEAFVNATKITLSPNKYVLQPKQSSSQTNRKRKKAKGPNRSYCSMKNYNQTWLRRIQSKVILPSFLPCDHPEPCSDETCSCIQNGFFCTKHCGWGSKSPNFFRGCECKAGQCRTSHCPCFAAKRECDPDLCRTCGACCDPADAPATGVKGGQRCRNDNISMRRDARTLIAESNIKQAGWGLFTKHSLKKGDFVHEYVGEIISQEEAERRGVIYDKLNMSYLFNLSSDFVVDSTRKGNKARYANHSSNPNIEPKMIHVNGDMRIGFFAKHDIDAQSELFFDYRYDDQMDNELIYKPDHSVNFDWMNKNNEGKKKS